MNNSPNNVGLPPRLISNDGIIAIVLCVLACGFGTFASWRLAGGSTDTLAITDYVVMIPPQQKKTFGYGGAIQTSVENVGTYKIPDVPFQSRAMSSFSFSISNRGDAFWIEGEEDRLKIGANQIDSHNPVRIADGTTFKAIGRYGSATFRANVENEPNLLRLQLLSPIYYPLTSDKTRVTFGVSNELVSSPVDEITIRTVMTDNRTESFTLEKKKEGAFLLKWEKDLALSPSAEPQLLSNLDKATQTSGSDVSVNSGASIPVGTVIIKLSGNAGSYFFSSNSASIFGAKIILVVLLFAAAFGLPGFGMGTTQVRLPHGPVIFGSVVVFAIIGFVLTARDYLLPPYTQDRFLEYSKWFFVSLVILYLIRIPIEHFRELRWIAALPIFVVIYILLNRPFEGLLVFPSIVSLIVLVLAFVFGAVVIHWSMRSLKVFLELAANADWFRVILVVCVPIVILMIVTIVAGGRSALTVFGTRIHLPTLLTPFLTLGTILTVTAAEGSLSQNWQRHRTLALASILFMVGLYYVLSGRDHGGTALISVGVFAGMWTASMRSRPWVFTMLLFGGFVMVICLAIAFGQERIDIAIGGIEGAQRYFDEWVNLRTARDLARAGGFFGLYERLYVPSSVSMNIYNDLVAAYVAGFFGLIGLALMATAYFLFYTRIFAATFKLIQSETGEPNGDAAQAVGLSSSRPEMPDPFSGLQHPIAGNETDPKPFQHVLSAFALSLTAVFLFQLLWMLTATFWSKIPFSGLDLQPISASRISIIAFIVILLGTISWIYNIYPKESRHEGI